MRKGAGPGRTRADHLDLAAQLLAALARARQARELADMVGEDALSGTDRQLHRLRDRLRASGCSTRAAAENRSLDGPSTWPGTVLGELPRRELTMLPRS